MAEKAEKPDFAQELLLEIERQNLLEKINSELSRLIEKKETELEGRQN